jgi:ferredoxin
MTRVTVDPQACDSTGLCSAIAPEVFELTERDELLVHAEAAELADWVLLHEAARVCPKLAITVHGPS